MQWILQEDKDNVDLAEILDRMGITYSVHSKLRDVAVPELVVDDPTRVIVFGYYSAQSFARDRGYTPGVFELQPYVLEQAWQPYLLNPRDAAQFIRVRDIPGTVPDSDRKYFVRPVEDSKTMSGIVLTGKEIRAKAAEVLETPTERLVLGRLSPDTELSLSAPVTIQKEWRVWVVSGKVVTWSLYKMAGQMVVRREIDQDALDFVAKMVKVNPSYSDAYVIDICRTEDNLRIIETNCINFSGYYDADLQRLVDAMEGLDPGLKHVP